MGIPLNPDKEQGPTTCEDFLGLEIDTLKMQIRLPPVKVSEICNILEHHLQKRTITLSSLQSIVGKLDFFSRTIQGAVHLSGVFITLCKETTNPITISTFLDL
jgi:hypothetical protein